MFTRFELLFLCQIGKGDVGLAGWMGVVGRGVICETRTELVGPWLCWVPLPDVFEVMLLRPLAQGLVYQCLSRQYQLCT